ncbi:WhiB family transcriptional regulator [Geodermatophilus sp. URMC 61]|uniref:WhiB family transcriptional regulator n=1 Tax=Geodermatophilus sp. URMC 61 TaxID=3423411 RepID=UPI00406BF021
MSTFSRPHLSLVPGPASASVLSPWTDLAPVGDPSWRLEALCAETDPEAFFPEKGGSTRDAKRVCSGCSVRAECLEFALANDERFGIWGGLSERERRRLRLQQRTGLSA